MLEGILFILGLFTTLGIMVAITINVKEENYKIGYLIALKDFLIKLFSGKNWFGIVLSVIVLIISIPAMLLILMVQILFSILMGMGYVWTLGKKKQPLKHNSSVKRRKI